MLDENQSKLSEDLMEFRRDASMLNVSIAPGVDFPSQRIPQADRLVVQGNSVSQPSQGLACLLVQSPFRTVWATSASALMKTVESLSLLLEPDLLWFASTGRAVAHQCPAEHGDLGL